MTDTIEVCIQACAGSGDRMVHDERTGELLGARAGAVQYPYAYGFVVGTTAADGDGLDCYIVTAAPLVAGDVLTCEPLGLVEQREGDEVDHKILASLPGERPALDDSVHRRLAVFVAAAFAEHPQIEVSLGPIQSRAAAVACVESSRRP